MPASVRWPPGRLLACCCALIAACKLYSQGGDAAVAAPCVETDEALTPALGQRVSVDRARLLEKVRGRRTSTLQWTGGRDTQIAFTFSEPEVFYVRSRPHAQLASSTGLSCTSRTEIRGVLAMSTEDGRLDEQQDATLISNGSEEAHGLVTVPAAGLVGAYEQRARTDGRCFDRLEVRVLFTADGVHGTLTEVSSFRACPDSVADYSEQKYSIGRWGERALHY